MILGGYRLPARANPNWLLPRGLLDPDVMEERVVLLVVFEIVFERVSERDRASAGGAQRRASAAHLGGPRLAEIQRGRRGRVPEEGLEARPLLARALVPRARARADHGRLVFGRERSSRVDDDARPRAERAQVRDVARERRDLLAAAESDLLEALALVSKLHAFPANTSTYQQIYWIR